MSAKYIIHTAEPVYRDGKQGEEAQLRFCYTNSLKLAVEYNCESIAFPLISSGIYGYPKTEALRVASRAIRDFISEHDIDVKLAVFNKEAFFVSKDLLEAIDSYIDEYYIEEVHHYSRRALLDVEREAFYSNATMSLNEPECVMDDVLPYQAAAAPMSASLDDIVGNLDEPFAVTLL